MVTDWMNRNCGNDFHWSGNGCDLIQILTSDSTLMGCCFEYHVIPAISSLDDTVFIS
jgi:hypothetical protein